jgi:NADPH:quinone reductase-like Zn-dependent oxidoreductase
MTAAVTGSYGGPQVVRVTEVTDPVPGTREVLIRITATTVSSGDSRLRGARFPKGFALRHG